MSIYEYACRSCGQEFETLVRGSETPSCAQCSSTELDKKLSVFAAQSGAADVPSACGSCGHPGGPGACALSQVD